MVTLAKSDSRLVLGRMNTRWFDVVLGGYAWLRDFVPAIGNLVTRTEPHDERKWHAVGQRFDEAVAAQRLAEAYYEKRQRISAVGVLADSAAQFSQGRFPATAVELIGRIVDAERNATALTTVAETCLKHGERKHLVAAVCLLRMAYEHDLNDARALELLVCAFEKMGLAEKARKVEAVLAELSEEERSSPAVSARPLPRS